MVVPGFAMVVGTAFHEANQWHRQLSWALALLLEFYVIPEFSIHQKTEEGYCPLH